MLINKIIPIPEWQTNLVFILGGGSSLNFFPLDLIKNRIVIGVNDAFKLGDFVDLCWFGDQAWYGWNKEELNQFKGQIWTCHESFRDFPCIHYIPRGNKILGLELDGTKIAWNRNSGASAINLAVLFGAKNIGLIGFDLAKGDNGQVNWHNHHKAKSPANMETQFLRWEQAFNQIAVEAVSLGVNIYNFNPESRIKCFEAKPPTKEGIESICLSPVC